MDLNTKIDRLLVYSESQKNKWLSLQDFFEFLKNLDTPEDVVLFVSNKENILISSLFVKKECLNTFNFGASFIKERFWDISWKTKAKRERKITEVAHIEDFDMPYIYTSFSGRLEGEQVDYFEFSQKMTNVLDLHYVPHKNAFCRFDESGDIEEIISEKTYKNFRYITFKRKYLDYYMWINNYVLSRHFDCTRVVPGKGLSATYEDEHPIPTFITSGEYQTGTFASFTHGYYIVNIQTNIKELTYYDKHFTFEKPKYETFIIYDFRYKKKRTCSIAPKYFTNYFEQKEKLPFETSPIFFKSEVLKKYQDNPGKYIIESRSISCPGWYLQCFDLNGDSVSTYPCYLRALPYQEQLYWKSYNIAPPMNGPLGGLSEQAWTNDFQGNFYTQKDVYAKLEEQKKKLSPFVKIQSIKIPRLLDENSKSWADNIGTLHTIFINSLPETKLKKFLQKKQITYNPKDKSISLLKQIFEYLGKDINILKILNEITEIRNHTHGHRNIEKENKLIEETKKKHSSLKQHYQYVLEKLCACNEELIAVFSDIISL